MLIEVKFGYTNSKEIKEIFLEYTEMVVNNNPNFEKYLQVRKFDYELEHLDDKYGLPEGRLYIAKVGNEVAGCIALKKIDNEKCEMKRLYVKPKFRGKNIANKLVQTIIDNSKKIGYKIMLLDTFPFGNERYSYIRNLGFMKLNHIIIVRWRIVFI